MSGHPLGVRMQKTQLGVELIKLVLHRVEIGERLDGEGHGLHAGAREPRAVAGQQSRE